MGQCLSNADGTEPRPAGRPNSSGGRPNASVSRKAHKEAVVSDSAFNAGNSGEGQSEQEVTSDLSPYTVLAKWGTKAEGGSPRSALMADQTFTPSDRGIGARIFRESMAMCHFGSMLSSMSTNGSPQSQRQSDVEVAPQGEMHLVEASTSWDIDSIALCNSTRQPLARLCERFVKKEGLAERLRIDWWKFQSFLNAVNDGYAPVPPVQPMTSEDAHECKDILPVPYHNLAHAVDVLHAMYHLIVCMRERIPLDDVDVLAALVAAAVHDLGHMGLTNDWHTRTWTDLAVRYSDRSVNESLHLQICFQLLKEPEMNFVADMDVESQRRFRKTVIELVLATDMAHHFHHLGCFREERKKEECEHGMTMAGLRIALKLADLRHCFHPWERHLQWTDLLEAEMWRQGDMEREWGLELGEFNDQRQPRLKWKQPDFFSAIVLDMAGEFCDAFPGTSPFISRGRANYSQWKNQSGTN